MVHNKRSQAACEDLVDKILVFTDMLIFVSLQLQNYCDQIILERCYTQGRPGHANWR